MYRKKMKYQEGSVGNSRQDVRLANDSQSTEFSKLLTRTRSKSLYRERVRVNATAGKQRKNDHLPLVLAENPDSSVRTKQKSHPFPIRWYGFLVYPDRTS
jgi:hypothetical protein